MRGGRAQQPATPARAAETKDPDAATCDQTAAMVLQRACPLSSRWTWRVRLGRGGPPYSLPRALLRRAEPRGRVFRAPARRDARRSRATTPRRRPRRPRRPTSAASRGRTAEHVLLGRRRGADPAVRPEDKPLFVAGFAPLAESVDALPCSRRQPAGRLAFFTEIDHVDHEAIGALDAGSRTAARAPARREARDRTSQRPRLRRRRRGRTGRQLLRLRDRATASTAASRTRRDSPAQDLRAPARLPRDARSWRPLELVSGFGLDHLPYGVVDGRCVVRYEDHVLDLRTVPGLPPVFDRPHAQPLPGARPARLGGRARAGHAGARGGNGRADPIREPQLPVAVGDYVDFYSSLEHATNVGRHVPARSDPLPPAWRASADRLPRPRGLGRRLGHADRAPARPAPELRPHRAAGLRARARVRHRPGQAARHADRRRRRARARLRLRARQRLERARHPALRVPPARPVPGQVLRDLDLAPGSCRWRRSSPTSCPRARRTRSRATYLRTEGDWALDIALEVELNGAVDQPHGNARGLYWTFPQQLAHATVNGAAVRPGDLFASRHDLGRRAGQQGSPDRASGRPFLRRRRHGRRCAAAPGRSSSARSAGPS